MLEIKCRGHNIDFISHKNKNTRSHLNQDRLHPNKKGNIWWETIFLLLLIVFTFESLYLQHQQACLEIVFLTVRIQMK